MKAVVIDALSGREVFAGEEEQEATQPFVFYLTQRLGWDPRQIKTRPQWRVPKTPSGARTSGYPVDIAIFDAPERVGDPEHVRILVECKAPSEEAGLDQLKTYLALEPAARVGIWFNGRSHVLVYKTSDDFIVNRYAPVPRPGDPLTPTAAKEPIRFKDLVDPPNLNEIFRRLRDQIAAQDSRVNRDEFILNDLANLLICKIADEQRGGMSPDRSTAFQLSSSRKATADAVRSFFEETKTRLRSVFADPEEKLHIDDASLETVVRTLQPYRLLGQDRQAVGGAFQILRGRALKGEEGAYFTPPPLVDCVVSVLDPTHETVLLDPASGTGGFLAAALNYVFERIEEKAEISGAKKDRAKSNWAKDGLYAVDKDVVSTKLCKAYLTLLGDGRAHVFRANTIDRGEWSDELSQALREDSFDMVMTNPPFGRNLQVPAEVGGGEGLLTCRKWKGGDGSWEPTDTADSQQLGLAFFERALALLKPGGRMAIVLPETFLFSKSFRWFVDWICRTVTLTHVVDVPMVAFEEFCRAKTCLLFVTRQAPPPGHRIWMSYPRSIGQDKQGNPLLRLDGSGTRSGELDNEMAEAAQELAARGYRGRPAPGGSSGESRFCFPVAQADVREREVLVPRFWWRRDSEAALAAWAEVNPCEIVTLGELQDEGVLAAFGGHGSPPGNARGTGDVPYVKVTDLKNWRINENPTNFIHEDVAEVFRRRGPKLEFGDLVSPARASSNIGQFSLVLPWQDRVVLTREVLVLRVLDNARGIDPFLLLALMSLKVVQRQYENLALMQTNREDLGDRWREVMLPLPKTAEDRKKISDPVRKYFEGIIQARKSYRDLFELFDPEVFGTRP